MNILTASKIKAFIGSESIFEKEISLNAKGFTEIAEHTFIDWNNLEKIFLNHNQIEKIHVSVFNGLVNLKVIGLMKNQIKQLDAFQGLNNLEEIHLNHNHIEKIYKGLFNGLIKLRVINLPFNQITQIDKGAFQGLNNLIEINLCDNKITAIDNETFSDLNNISKIVLSGNPIKQIEHQAFKGLLQLKELNFCGIPYLVSNVLIGLKLEKLTLFDLNEFSLKDFDLKNLNPNTEINKDNAVNIFGIKYESKDLNLSYLMTRNYLKEIKINSEYFCFNESFEWLDIPPKFTLLTGINGVGKTNLLKLIEKALNEKISNILNIVKYFNCKTLKNNFDFNINIDYQILESNFDRKGFSKILLKYINDFCLFQYFDYLLLCDYSIDDFKFNEKIFKYKISHTEFNRRKNEQIHFFKSSNKKSVLNDYQTVGNENKINLIEYYNQIKDKSIEYFLVKSEHMPLDCDHELSPGEYLILMLELWKLHAGKQKEENVKMEKVINNKLRILLLDEIDAHMHPKLIKYFIDLIINDDLEYLNLQVIMTSHNPITVSFTPIENIREITYENGRAIINNPKNLKQAMLSLTNHLVCIDIPERLVFVEATNDKLFYRILSTYLDQIKILENQEFNMIFIAGVTSDNKDSCKTFVKGLVQTCCDFRNNNESYGKIDHIFGIVDKDKDQNKPQTNILVLKRYALENYLFDPMILFLYSIETGNLCIFDRDHDTKTNLEVIFTNIKIEEVQIKMIFSLKIEKFKQLYKILIDYFKKILDPNDEFKGKTMVKFRYDYQKEEYLEIDYPNVFINHRGHKSGNKQGIKEKLNSSLITYKLELSNDKILKFVKDLLVVEDINKQVIKFIPYDLIEILIEIQNPIYQIFENNSLSPSYQNEYEMTPKDFNSLLEYIKKNHSKNDKEFSKKVKILKSNKNKFLEKKNLKQSKNENVTNFTAKTAFEYLFKLYENVIESPTYNYVSLKAQDDRFELIIEELIKFLNEQKIFYSFEKSKYSVNQYVLFNLINVYYFNKPNDENFKVKPNSLALKNIKNEKSIEETNWQYLISIIVNEKIKQNKNNIFNDENLYENCFTANNEVRNVRVEFKFIELEKKIVLEYPLILLEATEKVLVHFYKNVLDFSIPDLNSVSENHLLIPKYFIDEFELLSQKCFINILKHYDEIDHIFGIVDKDQQLNRKK